MNRTLKRLLLICIAVISALLVVVLSYVNYLIFSYSRIEDNLPLKINGEGENNVSVDTEYTVITQNLGFGAYTADYTFFMDGGKESRARSEQSVKQCITSGAEKAIEYSPDFVLFQEVDVDSDRSYHVNQYDLLTPYFQGYSHVFAQNYHSAYLFYPIFEPHGASNSGLVSFSFAKITSSTRRSLPISTGISKFLDLDRCYNVSRIPVENGKELVLINVHLSAYGGSDEIRSAQMNMLLLEIQTEYDKGNYVVCGGDFNHDFTGNSTQKLNGVTEEEFGWAMPFPADLLNTYPSVHRVINYTDDKLVPTCRNCDVPYDEGNFTIIVDGFLITPNVNVSYLENISTEFSYSDHNPVVMKFKLV